MRRFLPFCLVVVVGCTRDVSTKSAASNASRSMSTTHAATSAATAAAAGNQFAFDLFGKLRNQQPGSLFFSPYGIHVAFAMTSAGARGETADELAAALHFDPDQGDFHAALALLAQPLAAGAERDGYQLNIANRLWGQEGYGFVPDFLDLTRNRYGAELANVDFAQLASEPARAAINVWVEAQTKGKIEELIGRGMLDPLTRLVLVNAVYFKGRWKSRFDESNDASFHVSADETVTVPLMSQTGRFKHYVGEGVQIVELPYGDDGLAMIVVLPDDVDGLAALEERLSAEQLEGWLSQLAMRELKVDLPRFQIKSHFGLNEVMQSLGVRRAFNPGEADLTGISSSGELYLSAAVHEAFVDVNEEGTEAAGATGQAVSAFSEPPEPDTFRADHPFAFMIRDRGTGSILFLGRVVNPQPAPATGPRAEGEQEAQRAIDQGRLGMRMVGIPRPDFPAYAKLLKEKYGIDAVWTLGDLITAENEAQFERANGYNKRMMEAIRARFGEIDFDKLWEAAARKFFEKPLFEPADDPAAAGEKQDEVER